MNILVLGATGMAGHVTSLYLRDQGYSVTNLSAGNKLDAETVQLDVTKREEIEEFLKTRHFEVVVNCIGVLIQASEERKDLSTYLNSYFPHFLEYLFKDTETKIIHLSTDCVFSGNNGPYHEDSKYDGELFYDRTKALGEIINGKDLTFRMSIVGPELNRNGIGLFNWFYQQEGEVFGYSKVIWNGITTIELAKGIDAAIRQNLTGVYHLVPNASISKYDLLLIFKDVFIRDIIIEPKEDTVSNKTLINSRRDFNFTLPDYRFMVEEMKAWIDEHPDLYKHYK